MRDFISAPLFSFPCQCHLQKEEMSEEATNFACQGKGERKERKKVSRGQNLGKLAQI